MSVAIPITVRQLVDAAVAEAEVAEAARAERFAREADKHLRAGLAEHGLLKAEGEYDGLNRWVSVDGFVFVAVERYDTWRVHLERRCEMCREAVTFPIYTLADVATIIASPVALSADHRDECKARTVSGSK
jgi:hypothetical protein